MPPPPSAVPDTGAAALAPEPGSADDVCAREPIRVPGSIQPHGVLLGLDEQNRIVVVSDNVDTLLGRSVASLHGVDAATVIGPGQLASVLSAMNPADPEGVGGPLRLRLPTASDGGGLGMLAGAEVDVLVHRSTGMRVVELEPVLDALGAGAMSYRTAREALARITAAGSITTLCDVLAAEVHALTGFDRVMVYRFDANWNGEVVAERCLPEQEPYLGLHYPASDIPAQARELYVRNWTRLIADATYTPSALVPDHDPATGAPIDLSRAALRSVSPVHLQYLANMGVHASMSLSLVIDGRLWGLVACHHNSPHRPSFDARSAAEFLAQVASSAIDDREQADRREAELRAQQRVAALTDRISHDDTTLDVALVLAAEEMRELFEADSLVVEVVVDDTPSRQTFGAPVAPDLAERIVDLLRRTVPDDPVVTSDGLAALDPDLDPSYAGAMVVDLGDGRWLLALRHELARAVTWGGEPTVKVVHPPTRDGDLPTYGPRESFAQWQEVERGRSTPWQPPQVDAADTLRQFVDRIRVRRARDQLFVAESLQRALVMPVAPTIPGVDLATRYNPSESGILGGDWWDVVPTASGRYALVVGDVSGHGLDAAATMAQIRTSLRTYLLDGTPPGEALDRLDRAVATLMRRTIATCAIVEIDPVASEVSVLGAAHLPPVLVPADPTAPARALQTATRPPLGVQLAAALQPTVVALEPGDTLLTFSDGLVERRDTAIDTTMATLLALVEQRRPDPGLLDGWLGGVVQAGVGDGSDDTTALAARVRA
ncbi:SpoIIE family protein phosphatase [Jatrophihabitans sp. YIM 134969]